MPGARICPRSARWSVSTGIESARPATFDASAGARRRAPAEAERPDEPAEALQLEARYTFDSFVVGKANEVAYNAARTLAEGGAVTLQPAVPPWRHRARQDPPDARDRA